MILDQRSSNTCSAPWRLAKRSPLRLQTQREAEAHRGLAPPEFLQQLRQNSILSLSCIHPVKFCESKEGYQIY
jgi:hypothetical protein